MVGGDVTSAEDMSLIPGVGNWVIGEREGGIVGGAVGGGAGGRVANSVGVAVASVPASTDTKSKAKVEMIYIIVVELIQSMERNGRDEIAETDQGIVKTLKL